MDISNLFLKKVPDVATLSMLVFSWRDMKPITLNTANPAKKLVPELIMQTRIASLKQNRPNQKAFPLDFRTSEVESEKRAKLRFEWEWQK